MRYKPSLRVAVLFGSICLISLLHYETPVTHIWLHPLLQRAYYVPLLMMALWYGWRGGLIAAALAGLLYIPHIEMSWRMNPQYSATQKVEVGMFFCHYSADGHPSRSRARTASES